MKIQIAVSLLAFVLSQACITADAESPETEVAGASTPQESRWQLGIGLGYGERSNPLIQSDDIPIVVDVDIAWFGDRFFFDNGDLGLTFVANEFVTVNAVARANSDRVFFGKTNTRFVTADLTGQPLAEGVDLEVPDRDYAVEMGLELLADGRWGRVQMTAHHDVSNTHDGYEIRADYSVGWRNQRWYLGPSIGLSYKSVDMNNYYWGVRPDEANDALPAYEAESGINAHARLQFGYQISRHWTFALVGEFERLNSAAASSPVVDNRNVIGYFAGFGYLF